MQDNNTRSAKNEAVDRRDLILKKFDRWQPATPFRTPTDDASKTAPAPEFIQADSPAETQRLKALLLKNFDLAQSTATKGPETVESVPETAPDPQPVTDTQTVASEPVDPRDLILKKFDPWQPENRFKPQSKPSKPKPAPEFIQADTPEETGRLKTLLLKKFDLTTSTPAEEKTVGQPEATEAAVEEASGAAIETETTIPSGEATQEPAVAATPEPAAVAAAPQATPVPVDRRSIVEPPDAADDNAATRNFLLGFGLLIMILVGSSFVNTQRYAINEIEGGIEISKGIFAPMGYEPILAIPGATPPASAKEEYHRGDVYPIMTKYYAEMAKALMDLPGVPEFNEIRGHIENAQAYSLTPQETQSALQQMNRLERMLLTHQADLAIGEGSLLDLKNASAYLARAAAMEPSPEELKTIQAKQKSVKRLLAALAKLAAAKEEAQKAAAKVTPPPAENKK